jgi:Tfp pilus assembly protein PilO
MKLKFCKFIALIFMLLLMVSFAGCRSLFVNSPEKKAAQRQERENKEIQKEYRASVKDHYNNQSKKTKRRMKRNLKKAERKMKKRLSKGGWECR